MADPVVRHGEASAAVVEAVSLGRGAVGGVSGDVVGELLGGGRRGGFGLEAVGVGGGGQAEAVAQGAADLGGDLFGGDGGDRGRGEGEGIAPSGQATGSDRAAGLGSALGGRRNRAASSGQEQQASATASGVVAKWTGNIASVFASGQLLTAADISGSRQEQLTLVTERLREISRFGAAAEDYVVLTKGVLLEVARERELHKEAGADNFAQWAAGVLEVAEKYIFELLKDAERIRAVSQLKPELREQLTQASARKVVAEVVAKSGVERAEAVVEAARKKAAAAGRERPTAAMLSEAAAEPLDKKSIPAQQKSTDSDSGSPAADDTAVPAQLLALSKAADWLRERAYKPLAPGAVKTAADVDPVALGTYLDSIEAEVDRVKTRIAAARRLIPVDAEVVE
ncbi:hypothetical protein ACFQ2M_42410 [Kitasatospora saccharophila]|uniref:hypothetical protein n=1 Tax=Kitasatospora saccharophila TaxID=407973 RepID=UPI0031CF259A